MTRATTIENMKTTKSLKTKATLALVSLLLALMAAVVGMQSAAVAAPAASDTASDKAPSLANAKSAKSTLDDPAKKMPKALSKVSASKGFSASSTIVGQSGSPGHVALGPVWGVGYHSGQQLVSTPLADIYPSRAYSGNQVVTMKTTIGKREVFRGNYGPVEPWATPVYKYTIGGGGVQVPAKYYAGNDWTRNLYTAVVEVWWQTPGGRVIGHKMITLNQGARDYACSPGQNYGSYCNVWTNGLYLDRVG